MKYCSGVKIVFQSALDLTIFTPSNFSFSSDFETLIGVADATGASNVLKIAPDLAAAIEATTAIAIALLISIPFNFMIACLRRLFFQFKNFARKNGPRS
jgi:hypothetical protein